MMRRAIVLLALFSPGAGHGEIATVDQCKAAIASDPALAREDAAVWYHGGGGTVARLCEAAALEAMGAVATAARLLTGMAGNPNRAMDPDLRATVFEDGARLWLDAGQPDLALAAWEQARRLAPDAQSDLVLAARIQAANSNWPEAVSALSDRVRKHPDDAMAFALLAAARRNTNEPQAALDAAGTALDLEPYSPLAMFELGAAEAELGMFEAARESWTRLVILHPDHDLAAAASRNIEALD